MSIDKKSKSRGISVFAKILDKDVVPFVVTKEQMEHVLKEELHKDREVLLRDRYSADVMGVLRRARERLVWADGKLLKELFDREIELLLGPKTEEDLKRKVKGKKEKEKRVTRTILVFFFDLASQ